MNTMTSLAQFLGIQAAGKAFPVVTFASTTYEMLELIDSNEESAALQSVRQSNQLPGRHSPIIALPYKAFTGKTNLEAVTKKQGGTAWAQAGSNRRMGQYWHPRKDFTPKNSGSCPVGFVVHGATDSPYYNSL